MKIRFFSECWSDSKIKIFQGPQSLIHNYLEHKQSQILCYYLLVLEFRYKVEMCCTTTTNKKCTQDDKYECLDSLGGLIVANFDTSFQFIFLVWDGRGYEGLSEPVEGGGGGPLRFRQII